MQKKKKIRGKVTKKKFNGCTFSLKRLEDWVEPFRHGRHASPVKQLARRARVLRAHALAVLVARRANAAVLVGPPPPLGVCAVPK